MKVAVSYLKSDDYKKCINKINDTSADYLHVDMCDGKYVETKNFVIGELVKLLNNSTKKLDIHLMVKEPLKYIDDLALLNVETFTIHLDGCSDSLKTIEYIKGMGIKVGIAINPDESIDIIKPYLDLIDEVLVMSVIPGKGGQSFMMEVLPKFDQLNEIKKDYHFIIAVDGGINIDTINFVKEKNVDMVISGSYITESDNYEKNIISLK